MSHFGPMGTGRQPAISWPGGEERSRTPRTDHHCVNRRGGTAAAGHPRSGRSMRSEPGPGLKRARAHHSCSKITEEC